MQGWAGSPRDGLRALTSVLSPSGKNDVRFFRAESLRIAGELSRQSQVEKMTGYFEEAVELAREQGAVMLELRALTAALRAGEADPGNLARLRELLALAGDDGDPDCRQAREVIEAAG